MLSSVLSIGRAYSYLINFMKDLLILFVWHLDFLVLFQVVIKTIFDFKSSLELVLYVCYVSILNKTLNLIELKIDFSNLIWESA